MQKNNKLKILSLSILCLLTGCDGHSSKDDLIKFVENNRQSRLENKNKTTPTKLTRFQAVSYEANSYRDPFSMSVGDTKQKPTSSLQGSPVTALEFVGTITKPNAIYAYIIAPDKIIYQVKVGDSIGDKGGKVSRITENQVDVLEFTDADKDLPPISRTITLQLRSSP